MGSGTRNGAYVGLAVGCELGVNDGSSLGNREGVDVGSTVGDADIVGEALGQINGVGREEDVGLSDGLVDG